MSQILSATKETQTDFDGGFSKLSKAYRDRFSDNHLPYFCGGWAGYFGYDLAFHLEDIPRNPKSEANSYPDIALGYYTKGYIFDYGQYKAYSFGGDPDLESFDIADSTDIYSPPKIDFKSNFDQKTYEANVQKIIDYICAGDI